RSTARDECGGNINADHDAERLAGASERVSKPDEPEDGRTPRPEERLDDADVSGAARTPDEARPRFASSFPPHPELDTLVRAFARGDYRTIRLGAPKLIRGSSEDPAVKRAAARLLAA